MITIYRDSSWHACQWRRSCFIVAAGRASSSIDMPTLACIGVGASSCDIEMSHRGACVFIGDMMPAACYFIC